MKIVNIKKESCPMCGGAMNKEDGVMTCTQCGYEDEVAFI